MSEYWDILDADGEKTGKRVKRERFGTLGVGQYHLVVHVWITNSSGEFLIQKRSRNKQPMPGEWAATSGSVKSGEDSRTAAIRELYEELGIPVKFICVGEHIDDLQYFDAEQFVAALFEG